MSSDRESANKKAKKFAVKTAAVISIMIFIILQLSEISAFVQSQINPPLIIYLEEPTDGGEIEIETLEYKIESGQYVSNYNAAIYFDFDREEVEIGDPVVFNLSIENTGIIPLSKPYFYVFITDSDKKIQAVFPPVRHHEIDEYNKWPEWSMSSNGSYTDTLHVTQESGEYYIPRAALIGGQGNYLYSSAGGFRWATDLTQIKFGFTIDETSRSGFWSVYVFVFDEQYLDRKGQEITSNNAIVCREHLFHVSTRDRPGGLPSISSSTITASIAALSFFMGIYAVIRPNYTKIIKFKGKVRKWIKENKYFLIGFLVFLFIAIISLFS